MLKHFIANKLQEKAKQKTDIPNRQAAAWLIRQHFLHMLTIPEMLKSWPASTTDPSLTYVARLIYQLQEEGGFLETEEGLALLERCGRFLESNKPYLWPETDFAGAVEYPWYIHVATFGLTHVWQNASNKMAEENFNKLVGHEDFPLWPYRKSQLSI